jgi:uncharacterized OsmC-like protein
MPTEKKARRGKTASAPKFSGRFGRLREHFIKNPDKALRAVYADIDRMVGLHSYARTDEFTVESDEPEGIGGTNKGPTPTQLFLASMAHCQAITLRIYAEGLGLVLDEVTVKINGVLDLRGYYSFEDEKGEPVDPSIQTISIKTYIVTHETEAKVRQLIESAKGKGVCLSTVEKGLKIRYYYWLNGKHLRV